MSELFRTVWSIVADGTLFKGSFVLVASCETDAIEKTKSALGKEGGAASVRIKSQGVGIIELGRSEYPAEQSASASETVPHIAKPFAGFSPDRFVFDVAGRANVIASTEDDALRKMGHALLGKEVQAVKFMRTKVSDPEPMDELSSYERHLLERQFRAVRVAST